MRLFLFVLLLFAIPLVAFLVLNDAEQVTIDLGTAVYPEVPVWIVVLLSLATGAGLVGIIAVAEGAAIRLANRKLRRELRALETEVNLLRTEPAGGPAPLVERPAPRAAVPAAPERPAEHRPSAPVYGREEFDAYTDD